MYKLTHEQIGELVVLAQQGDQQAFAALYTATVDRQLYFASAFLKDTALAEDAVQEVYLKAFRALDKLENPRVFVAYLNRICYTTCVDYKRKHGGNKYELNEEALLRTPDQHRESAPQDHVELQESSSTLQKAINTLPDHHREAFLLRHYQELKIKEVATAMDISESTAKRYIRAATHSLKNHLTHPPYMEGGAL